MSSALLRQFTEGKNLKNMLLYSRVFGVKRQRILDQVIPDISQNLLQTCQTFLQGVVNYDTQFIQSASSNALQKVLIDEIQKLKRQKTSINFVDYSKNNKESQSKEAKKGESVYNKSYSLSIAPYVIFGQNIEQRTKAQNPWQNCFPISSNRYIYKSIEGFSLKRIMNIQIFGFNCFYKQFSKGYEISTQQKTQTYEPKEMVLSFETDSQNHQFFITDFNGMIRYPQIGNQN